VGEGLLPAVEVYRGNPLPRSSRFSAPPTRLRAAASPTSLLKGLDDRERRVCEQVGLGSGRHSAIIY
jgi:hypothetical protein